MFFQLRLVNLVCNDLFLVGIRFHLEARTDCFKPQSFGKGKNKCCSKHQVYINRFSCVHFNISMICMYVPPCFSCLFFPSGPIATFLKVRRTCLSFVISTSGRRLGCCWTLLQKIRISPVMPATAQAINIHHCFASCLHRNHFFTNKFGDQCRTLNGVRLWRTCTWAKANRIKWTFIMASFLLCIEVAPTLKLSKICSVPSPKQRRSNFPGKGGSCQVHFT